MLQYGTVEPHTLDLIKELMAIPDLENLYLVGGTALALYYGHPLSINLDLFSTTDFKNEPLLPLLENKFPGFTYWAIIKQQS